MINKTPILRRTKVKICGLTRVSDALDAAALGADAIGLVFYPPSARALTPERASEIVAALPAFVTTVGLFVDAEPAEVEQVLAKLPLDRLQFHGREAPEYCAGFGRPWVKALAMRDGIDLDAEMVRWRGASSILLDTYDPQLAGGTGKRFDWTRVPSAMAGDIILAGGLRPDNVAEAVRTVRPYAVDVSGGVEAEKGIKDGGKMAAFLRGVFDGDNS